MPRQRMIKPKFWDDTKLAKVSRDSRLLFIGLWNFSDDNGIVIGSAAWIKAKIFPFDELEFTEITKWVLELQKIGVLRKIQWENEPFLYIKNFPKHQTINRPNVDDLFIPNDQLQSALEEEVINQIPFNDESVMNHCPKKRKEEEKKRKEKAKPTAIIDSVIYPFGDEFKKQWLNWKEYKKLEFKFQYISPHSEQAAVQELANLCKGEESIAILIIAQSMAKGWKGFFELKNNDNGQGKKPTGNSVSTGSILSKINSMPDKT